MKRNQLQVLEGSAHGQKAADVSPGGLSRISRTLRLLRVRIDHASYGEPGETNLQNIIADVQGALIIRDYLSQNPDAYLYAEAGSKDPVRQIRADWVDAGSIISLNSAPAVESRSGVVPLRGAKDAPAKEPVRSKLLSGGDRELFDATPVEPIARAFMRVQSESAGKEIVTLANIPADMRGLAYLLHLANQREVIQSSVREPGRGLIDRAREALFTTEYCDIPIGDLNLAPEEIAKLNNFSLI